MMRFWSKNYNRDIMEHSYLESCSKFVAPVAASSKMSAFRLKPGNPG